MFVKVYIQLTEVNRCVKVAVEKTFLWRICKEIVPATQEAEEGELPEPRRCEHTAENFKTDVSPVV